MPWLARFAVVIVLLAPSVVRAQQDSYRTLIAAAVAEFDAQRFEEARALFVRAHELSPNARTLRGIGLASFELRDYPEAHRALTAALADTRRALDPEQIEEVRALLGRTRQFLGIYRIVTSPDDARVEIDGGAAVIEPDGRVLLGLGTHAVRASARGHRDRALSVRVSGREDEELRIELEPAVTAAATLPTAEPSEAVLPPSDGGDARGPVIVLALGGIAAAASLVTGLGWWLPMDGEHESCVRAGPGCDNLPDVTTSRDAAAGTTIALALASAGVLVAGGIWLATSSDSGGAASVRCLPAGSALVCGGWF